MSLRRALACVIGAATLVAQAQAIEIFELRHRSAEQVLPVIQAIVGPRGAVTGAGFKLFVRADDAALADVKRTLARLDTPPRRLSISVRRVETTVPSRVEIIGGAGRQAGPANVVGTHGAATAGRLSTDPRADVLDEVQALEDTVAYVRTGDGLEEAVAVVPSGSAAIAVPVAPAGTVAGFYAVPHVDGDRVALDISPQREVFGAHGEVRRLALRTQVSGRLGDWIDLGVMRTQGGMRVQVKVEEIK